MITWSVDVELDLHAEVPSGGGKDLGVSVGLKRFEKICDRHGVKPVLFVVGSLVRKHRVLLKRLARKGWDISCHGFSHRRFDDLSLMKKRRELENCRNVWKKELGFFPKGFRAPQHSVDTETLDLLEELGFEYDSSMTPLNVLQLVFFPSRLQNWWDHFWSSTGVLRVRKGLVERPVAGLGVGFVSLLVRVLPVWMLHLFVWKLSLFYDETMFYAHSWDFVEQRGSRIDKKWGHDLFLEKLDRLMEVSR